MIKSSRAVRGHFRYALASVLLCVLLLILSSSSVLAAEKGSITITAVTSDGVKLSQMPVSIYKVAERTADGKWKLTADFSSVKEDLEDVSSEDVKLFDQKAEKTSPYATGVTNAEGVVTFSNLGDGVYLVRKTGEPALGNGYTADMRSFIVAVPSSGENGEPVYNRDINAAPKCTVSINKVASVTVYKEWIDDNDRQGKRPESIRVVLKNGEKIIDTQTLSASNNWTYTWTGLEPSSDYRVVEEKVPKEYISSVSKPGKTVSEWSYTITNRLKQDRPPKVQTGDYVKIGMWIGILIAAIVLLMIFLKKKK